MRFIPICLASALGLAVGCLGSMPTGGNGATGGPTADAGVGGVVDLASPPDLAHQPADLRSTDLAGLVDCFEVTVCDPTMNFCIRLNSGSATNPGTVTTPACYQPADCMGANMDCDCITQDPVLSVLCANCVDHMDGTYDCYAQQ
jgi:hypothetical protein